MHTYIHAYGIGHQVVTTTSPPNLVHKMFEALCLSFMFLVVGVSVFLSVVYLVICLSIQVNYLSGFELFKVVSVYIYIYMYIYIYVCV